MLYNLLYNLLYNYQYKLLYNFIYKYKYNLLYYMLYNIKYNYKYKHLYKLTKPKNPPAPETIPKNWLLYHYIKTPSKPLLLLSFSGTITLSR